MPAPSAARTRVEEREGEAATALRGPCASPGLTTLTLFGFPPSQRAWAFAQMGLARAGLMRSAGFVFWRLLGSGRGGFSLRPDFGRYGFLGVWRGERDGAPFGHVEAALPELFERASEVFSIALCPLRAHGTWGGERPFVPASMEPSSSGPVAVITRATLRLSTLRAFWRAVPSASAAIASAEGCLCSIGVGELPFVQQATFSVWRSLADVRRFAYRDGVHKDIVQRTREERWYAEELFARFRPLAWEGELFGQDPLASLA